MIYKSITLLIFISILPHKIPHGFGAIAEAIPGITIEARYATTRNFIGQKIPGYNSDNLLLSVEAIAALKKVQSNLNEQGLGLKVFDAYRPQRAVDYFVAWCADDADTINKHVYYPNVAKTDLLPTGYIAAKSGHSRGSTLDLTIINLTTGEELDMGTPWDYFGPESWGSYQDITSTQKHNRQLLANIMAKHGFKSLPEEWWHFTLANEPYPNTYFDFVVE